MYHSTFKGRISGVGHLTLPSNLSQGRRHEETPSPRSSSMAKVGSIGLFPHPFTNLSPFSAIDISLLLLLPESSLSQAFFWHLLRAAFVSLGSRSLWSIPAEEVMNNNKGLEKGRALTACNPKLSGR